MKNCYTCNHWYKLSNSLFSFPPHDERFFNTNGIGICMQPYKKYQGCIRGATPYRFGTDACDYWKLADHSKDKKYTRGA